MDRRNFVKSTAALTTLGAFMYPVSGLGLTAASNPALFAYDTDFDTNLDDLLYLNYSDPTNEKVWSQVRRLFPRPKYFTQLENGYFSHTFLQVRKFHQEREDYIQNLGSFYMRREQETHLEEARTALAKFFGWDKENLAITRNTTESLNTVISGFPWKAGDEVIIGNQDYGSMTESFQQAAARFGIVIKTAKIPLHPINPQELTEAYLKLVTPKTRMVHLTHLINLSGQIIPIEDIVTAIRDVQNGEICVVVDAAHSVAHIDHNWAATGADIVAGSLHKWMCAPIGIGFLYVKTPWIPEIWPLMADRSIAQTNIRRFEHQGTRPVQTHEALVMAIEMQRLCGGIKNKEQRLRYLRKNWTDAVTNRGGISINTPATDSGSCAISNVSVESMTPSALSALLWEKYKIFTVAIEHPAIQGVRITPHLSNTLEDTGRLAEALLEITKA